MSYKAHIGYLSGHQSVGPFTEWESGRTCGPTVLLSQSGHSLGPGRQQVKQQSRGTGLWSLGNIRSWSILNRYPQAATFRIAVDEEVKVVQRLVGRPDAQKGGLESP